VRPVGSAAKTFFTAIQVRPCQHRARPPVLFPNRSRHAHRGGRRQWAVVLFVMPTWTQRGRRHGSPDAEPCPLVAN